MAASDRKSDPPPPYVAIDESDDTPRSEDTLKPPTIHSTKLQTQRNDLVMERPSKRNPNDHACKESQQNKGKSSRAAASWDLPSPNKAETKTLSPHGTCHITWLARKLASNIKMTWGRWRKDRKEAKEYYVVATIKEFTDEPQWNGKVKIICGSERNRTAFLRLGDPDDSISLPQQKIKQYCVTPTGTSLLQVGSSMYLLEPCKPYVTKSGRIAYGVFSRYRPEEC